MSEERKDVNEELDMDVVKPQLSIAFLLVILGVIVQYFIF